MKTFDFSYDEDNDDLFIYLPGAKSAGAVEMGDFVFDFDKNENLVAMQIMNVSEVLSKLISKIVSLKKIKSVRTTIVSFRNMKMISLEVEFDNRKERVNIAIPRVTETSPALRY